jgi:hypothetical protein
MLKMLSLLTNASEKCLVRSIYRNQKMSFEFERGVRRQCRNPSCNSCRAGGQQEGLQYNGEAVG